MTEIEALDASWVRNCPDVSRMIVAGVREVLKRQKVSTHPWRLQSIYDADEDILHIRVYRREAKGVGVVTEFVYSGFLPDRTTWGHLITRVTAAGEQFGAIIAELNHREA